MNSPETPIPQPRTSAENTLRLALGAIATLTDIYTTTRRATASAHEVAFAALDFGRLPFIRADVYRRLNTQYSGRNTLAGDGPKQAMEYFENNGFVVRTEVDTESKRFGYISAKYLKVGSPLVTFARGYNFWHLELIQTCQGEDMMESEEIRELSLRSFAASHDLSLHNVTAERLAAQTNMHPESVKYLALDGWATHRRLAASAQTLRNQHIREAYESALQKETTQLVQTDGSLQAVTPGEVLTT